MATSPNKNAYELASSSGPVTWIDRKGKWSINGLIRKKSHFPEQAYETRVTFQPNPLLGFRVNGEIYRYVLFIASMTPIHWKGKLKNQLGYTPSREVLNGMYDHLQCLRIAHEEEDAYYAGQSKAEAGAVIDECFVRAINRYQAGVEEPASYRYHRRSVFDRFVTSDDKTLLIEAYKVLNESAYVEPEEGIYGGHLHEFRVRLETAIDLEEKKREFRMKLERREWLENLLESDPPFRRLVALALMSNKIKRGYGYTAQEKELGYCLFGYAKDLKEYRKVHDQLQQVMKIYRLETYDTKLLIDLGQSYLRVGEMLPALEPPHVRKEGFFYGDEVKLNGRSFEVNKVGHKYLYLSGGNKVLIEDVLKKMNSPFTCNL